VVSTLAFTAIDYVFKAELSAALPPAALGPFFAWFYAGVNAAALLVQLLLSGRVLRAFGVHRALAAMPGLLLGLVVGFACAPGLLAVLLVKSADGAMRHSLHRTGMEVLHLPLSPETRARFKGLVDGLGQRGGQVLASVGILVATRLGLGPAEIAWAIAALVALWLFELGALFALPPFDRSSGSSSATERSVALARRDPFEGG
jgi:AAA family ATP:ADP antiporter